MTGYTPYFLLYGRHPILAFDIADSTWEALDWHTVHSTEDLIAIRTQQILRRDKNLALAHENQRKNRQRAVDDFNKRYEKILVGNDFAVGTWIWVHETWLDTQKGNKGALRWSGPFIIHERVVHEGALKGYKIWELDGNVRRSTVPLDRVKIFYYRNEHQTIKTSSTEAYVRLTKLFPDPDPLLHCDAYQRGVALTQCHPLSYLPDIQPAFQSLIPILDIADTIQNLGVIPLRRMDDWELRDLGWEHADNDLLVYEPFLRTSRNNGPGLMYRHPMIGDLDDMFQNGTKEVWVAQKDRWAPRWSSRLERVTHNVLDLAKWTDELVALRPNYR
jgi:hypothetical protein